MSSAPAAANIPPPEALPTADFFHYESLLSPGERHKLVELRDFLATEIAPHASDW